MGKPLIARLVLVFCEREKIGGTGRKEAILERARRLAIGMYTAQEAATAITG